MLNAIVQRAAFGLCRLLEALAGSIEQPTVKGAAQAAVFKPAEGKIRPAVAAMPPQKTVAAILVPKHDQVLTEETNRTQRAFAVEFLGQGNGLPIVSMNCASRRARTDLRDQLILFRAHHGRRHPHRAAVYDSAYCGKPCCGSWTVRSDGQRMPIRISSLQKRSRRLSVSLIDWISPEPKSPRSNSPTWRRSNPSIVSRSTSPFSESLMRNDRRSYSERCCSR